MRGDLYRFLALRRTGGRQHRFEVSNSQTTVRTLSSTPMTKPEIALAQHRRFVAPFIASSLHDRRAGFLFQKRDAVIHVSDRAHAV